MFNTAWELRVSLKPPRLPALAHPVKSTGWATHHVLVSCGQVPWMPRSLASVAPRGLVPPPPWQVSVSPSPQLRSRPLWDMGRDEGTSWSLRSLLRQVEITRAPAPSKGGKVMCVSDL